MAKLIAWINGERTGTLTLHHNGALHFQYDANWLQHPLARPLSLSLPLQRAAMHSEKVVHFFENLLFPSALIEKDFYPTHPIKSCEVFAALQKVGHTLPGALSLLPAKRQPVAPDQATQSIFTPADEAQQFDIDNAYLCLSLARELTIPVPDAVLVHENGIRKLRTERYDRRWRHDGQHLYHLPEEDVCQALGVPLSGRDEQQGGPGIDDIMALLMGSSSAMKDREDLMRCLVFQWLTGITRVNAKHLSLLIARGGSFRLAPFKHLLSACPGLSLRTTDRRDFQLGIGLTGPEGKQHHIDAIGPAHFLALAGSVGFSQAAMRQILAAFIPGLPAAIIKVRDSLPDDYPLTLADAVFSHAMMMLERVRQAI
ncbi:MAG: type II toxin-antitoxin system HipA family toxin [Pantoea ananatis]|uniref:HipA domain-containing protein n=1 Tax=Pantoea TaxID=53335 RepID=UPI000E25951E|nr:MULTISPECIES: HipA domain-containing protein [Pantoea]MCS4493104.1 HipA domain-containing protein [Pantoea sp. B623]NEK80462.1 type II toxin-antitoxin system HipA family toxin [Pantoea ananatis]REF12121.1 serine/threonine-protein kinase HipA [Pantoea ananatis]